MKKLFFCLTVLATVLLTSCGSDDDGGGQDAIVGTWELASRINIENGSQSVDDLGCEAKEPITFNTDGTFVSTDFDINNEGDCVELDKTEGTWENSGSGIYTFSGVEIEVSFSGNSLVTEFESEGIVTRTTYTKK